MTGGVGRSIIKSILKSKMKGNANSSNNISNPYLKGQERLPKIILFQLIGQLPSLFGRNSFIFPKL